MILYDNINKYRAILIQKLSIFKLNPCFIYIILKIMAPEQYTKRVKGNKSTVGCILFLKMK